MTILLEAMPWAIMIRCFCILVFICLYIQVNAQWIGATYGVGYHLAIHPDYPLLQNPTHSVSVQLTKRASKSKWAIGHNKPYIGLNAAWQTTSNSAILGDVVHIAATITYPLVEKEKWALSVGGGLGLAYVTKRFDSFTNPGNIVIGAHVNAVALLDVQFRYFISKRLASFVSFQYAHYSNSRFVIPNIGMNIPQCKLGFSYRIHRDEMDASLKKEDQTHDEFQHVPRLIFPFIRIGLGMTEIGTNRGPKHPSYCVEIGAQRIMSDISKLSLSLEYLYDWSTYRFINNQTENTNHWSFARMSLQLGHELMFGHISLVTTLGVYLNKHAYQRSILLSKIGVQCYLHSYFKQLRHQVMLGAFIRSYAGEAERFEILLGYHF